MDSRSLAQIECKQNEWRQSLSTDESHATGNKPDTLAAQSPNGHLGLRLLLPVAGPSIGLRMLVVSVVSVGASTALIA